MRLRRTTKMALQAAMAIALAELINMCIYFDRGYWIVLTAMVLTTQTWGESVKRALERVGMTVLGGVTGTALYFSMPEQHSNLLMFLMLMSIFFMVYMAKIQHLISMFFLTCFVVFLFALIGDWDLSLLRARIIDTALGAIIALVVGGFFFTTRTNIAELLIQYLQKINAQMTTAFNMKGQSKTLITGHALLAEFQSIKKNAISIRYELLFHRLNPNDFNILLNQMALCTQYVISLIEAYLWLFNHLTEEENSIVGVAVRTTQHNIDVIILRLQNSKKSKLFSATNLPNLLKKDIEEDPRRFASLESDALGFFNLMYFFTRLNKHLHEVYLIVEKAY